MNSSAVALVVLGLCAGLQAQDGNVGWAHNGGLPGDHYSPLTRVTPANVAQLREVWMFDMEPGGLERFAALLGKENVIAGADCGFGGRTHPQIAWAKLRSLADGAKLAAAALWGGVNSVPAGADNMPVNLTAV